MGQGAFSKRTWYLKVVFSLIICKSFFKLRKHCESVSNLFWLSRIKISWERFSSFLSRIYFNNITFFNEFCFKLLENLKSHERKRFSFWKLPKRFMSITSSKLTCFGKSVFAKFTTDLFLISKTPASLKLSLLELIFSMNSSFFFEKKGPSHHGTIIRTGTTCKKNSL